MTAPAREVLLPIADLGERWHMANDFGSVESEKTRDGSVKRWYLLFRVTNPSTGLRDRERVYSGLTQHGQRVPFQSEEMAQIYLDSIRADIRHGRTEYQAIAPYLWRRSPENRVKARWARYCRARRDDRDREPVSDDRLYELERMVDRGYLDFFDECSIFELSSTVLDRWVRWMMQRWPAHRPKTRHHIVNDFMGFASWLQEARDIFDLPTKPRLPKLEKRRRPVPSEEALARYLAAIPEQIRGLWLIRGYDGLRPSEARRLNVANYDWRTRVLAIEDSKTETGIRTFEVDWEVGEWLDRWVELEQRMDRERPLFVHPGAADLRWKRTPEVRVHDQASRDSDLVNGDGKPLFAPNHMGRHAAATHMMARTKTRTGAHDIDAVKRKLGHRERSTTETYVDSRVIEIGSLARLPRPKPL
jgi:integrase